MRRAILTLLLSCALAGVASANAIEAVTWLKANQNASGSWGEVWFSTSKPTTETRDSAAVIQALISSNAASGSEFTDGTTWLSSAEVRSTDTLARRVRALGDSGFDVSDDVVQLLQNREPLRGDLSVPGHTGGGWGVGAGFASDSVDTSLALLALESRGLAGGLERRSLVIAAGAPSYLSFTVPTTATKVRLTFFAVSGQIDVRLTEGAQPLLSEPYFQLTAPALIEYPDSGLPFTPGENWIRVDSAAGATLWMVASWEDPTIDTRVVAEAVDFLRSCQNGDGGIGLEPGGASTFFATANAMRTLGRLGLRYDTQGEVAAAVVYLDARQLPSGLAGHDTSNPTTIETALAKLAFGDAGAAAQELLGHSALLASQGAQGDWDADSHTTAVALEAITTVPEPNQVVALLCGAFALVLLAQARRRAAE